MKKNKKNISSERVEEILKVLKTFQLKLEMRTKQ
jgi:inorganic pyrophosphatase/exopolyphosphatase